MEATARATTAKRVFSRETSVAIEIDADTATIWNLLTNAQHYPRWNSTVISIDGSINADGRIRLKSHLSPDREFKLKIRKFEPERLLVWGNGLGVRTFTIEKISPVRSRFTMTERIGGPVFPLFSRMIPSFDESFERFAADLKTEAEKSAS